MKQINQVPNLAKMMNNTAVTIKRSEKSERRFISSSERNDDNDKNQSSKPSYQLEYEQAMKDLDIDS